MGTRANGAERTRHGDGLGFSAISLSNLFLLVGLSSSEVLHVHVSSESEFSIQLMTTHSIDRRTVPRAFCIGTVPGAGKYTKKLYSPSE
jgi:hypothetical protein